MDKKQQTMYIQRNMLLSSGMVFAVATVSIAVVVVFVVRSRKYRSIFCCECNFYLILEVYL